MGKGGLRLVRRERGEVLWREGRRGHKGMHCDDSSTQTCTFFSVHQSHTEQKGFRMAGVNPNIVGGFNVICLSLFFVVVM